MEKFKVTVYPNTSSPKLFKNKFLEFLTKTHPIVIDMMYATISFFMIRHYITTQASYSVKLIVGLFLMGFLSWSLAEYLLHRFLYHKIEDATFDSGIQYLFHGIHHEYPNDGTRLVLPWIPSLIIATIFFSAFYLVMGSYAFLFAPGFMMGYCAYMTVHYTVHKVAPPKRFNFWWKFHNIHHFQQHDRAFGVTSPLWDIVFRTMPENNRRTVEVEMKKKSKEEH